MQHHRARGTFECIYITYKVHKQRWKDDSVLDKIPSVKNIVCSIKITRVHLEQQLTGQRHSRPAEQKLS